MTASMEGPNPLRPYYIPPTVGPPSEYSPTFSSPSNISKHATSASGPSTSFGSSARNILADMDYAEYLPESSPSAAEVVKRLLEQAVWKYTSVFLAQPFDVAKTVLQVQLPSSGQKAISPARAADDSRRRMRSYRNDSYEVCPSQGYILESPAHFSNRCPPMIQIPIPPPISLPPLLYHIHHLELRGLVDAEVHPILPPDLLEALHRTFQNPLIHSSSNLPLPC